MSQFLIAASFTMCIWQCFLPQCGAIVFNSVKLVTTDIHHPLKGLQDNKAKANKNPNVFLLLNTTFQLTFLVEAVRMDKVCMELCASKPNYF